MCKHSNVLSLAVLMVEGLIHFFVTHDPVFTFYSVFRVLPAFTKSHNLVKKSCW
jgi:hypothetical protein